MRVIVYAQDLSGRRDDGYYSKPDLASALNIFFGPDTGGNTSDEGGESVINREDAEAIFAVEKRVTFFNEDGEKVVISADPSA
jgi:hypothetical protein